MFPFHTQLHRPWPLSLALAFIGLALEDFVLPLEHYKAFLVDSLFWFPKTVNPLPHVKGIHHTEWNSGKYEAGDDW